MAEFDDSERTDERATRYGLTDREVDDLSQVANRSIGWFQTRTDEERHEAVKTIIDEFQERYNQSEEIGADEENVFVRLARQHGVGDDAVDAEAVEDPDPDWFEVRSSAVEDITPKWPTDEGTEDE